MGKLANFGPKLTYSYASGFSQLKEFFLNLCTKKVKRYTKLPLLVLPKKFLFVTNIPNLRSKMLVVGTLDPISRNSLNWQYESAQEAHQKYVAEFQKKIFRNLAERCNSHVTAFAETNAFQANGEICPLSFQI